MTTTPSVSNDSEPLYPAAEPLRQIRAVIAVCEEGSFTRAAERLGMTRSAVSKHIARLEQTVRGAQPSRAHAIIADGRESRYQMQGKADDAATPDQVDAGLAGGHVGDHRLDARRQLTVLFCDLVGSTALAERLQDAVPDER